jgi:transposase-like protein
VKSKADHAPQGREDISGRRPRTAWPLDVMLSAVMAVVDQDVAVKRVADELRIPYTTLADWVKKYRSGGRAALDDDARGRHAS